MEQALCRNVSKSAGNSNTEILTFNVGVHMLNYTVMVTWYGGDLLSRAPIQNQTTGLNSTDLEFWLCGITHCIYSWSYSAIQRQVNKHSQETRE